MKSKIYHDVKKFVMINWEFYKNLKYEVGFVGSLTSLCHSNGHIETMPARELIPLLP